MANLTDADVKEAGNYNLVLDGDTVPDTARLPIYLNGTLKEITVARLKTLLGVTPTLPTPLANTFSNFSDTALGGSVVLVPATGVPITDYFYKIGPDGDNIRVPSTGIISVGNVDASVYTYAVGTPSRGQSPVAVSQAFTKYTGSANTTPPAPTFADFIDTDAGGSIRLVPAAGLVATDYVYRVGQALTTGDDIYTSVPNDGIITVGNVAGNVYAYSIAVTGRNQSQTAVSPQAFTVYSGGTSPDPGITTPTYVGVSVTTTPNNAAVQAMPSFLWSKTARQLHFSCNDTYPTFAEPASFGVRSIIQDKNGFNITGDVARTSITLTVNSVATPYYLYVHQNPQFDTDFVEQI